MKIWNKNLFTVHYSQLGSASAAKLTLPLTKDTQSFARQGVPQRFTLSLFTLKSFTLAEILITLGIIGVVASITVPVLMNNIQDAQFRTAYKKAYSVASQAMESANSEYLLVPTTGSGDSNHGNNFLAWMNQLKVSKKCINNDNDQCWDSTGEKFGLSWDSVGFPKQACYSFIDASGMAWSIYTNYQFWVFVDTNGFKKPNQYGKDRFAFKLVNNNGTSTSGLPIKISPYPDYSSTSTSDDSMCYGNKCATDKNYYGTSWLYN